ncbi:helix-turn-helix transcriptional regulator [Streptomyces sp. 549]|uniref:helix-turn-helix domain-containing protein n=1 Tax=Streptomyces sp. 549 TaxID=3049076 RepID=UPI0024C36389|nr:helix-turn-helix transcriptional regulator [Streptomyces sp. 549]MDK1474845.1 helix-turn-helix transcriptional regulator [Streptomyces sp. 549]
MGVELRNMRLRAGMAARQAAVLLGTDQGKISNIESGRIGISASRIRRLAGFYDCEDERLIEALCGIAGEHRGQYWWDEYRGRLPSRFLDLAELEYHAAYLRSAHTVVVPGLLQTREYARALFASNLDEALVEAKIEHRVRRREIFERANPTPFDVVVHEAALHMRFGGRAVVQRQLEFLLDASAWPSVALRVLPFSNERFIEATHSTLYAGGVVPQLDTVQIDTPLGGVYVDEEAQLSEFATVLADASAASLSEDASRRLVHQRLKEI